MAKITHLNFIVMRQIQVEIKNVSSQTIMIKP